MVRISGLTDSSRLPALRFLRDDRGPGDQDRNPIGAARAESAVSMRIFTNRWSGPRVPLRNWVLAIDLEMTSLKGVSSTKLHRDLKVTQKTAWFMLDRIRGAWDMEQNTLFSGPVDSGREVFRRDSLSEPALREAKKPDRHRRTLGMAAVAGAKDRATNRVSARTVRGTDTATLQGFCPGNGQARRDGLIRTKRQHHLCAWAVSSTNR